MSGGGPPTGHHNGFVLTELAERFASQRLRSPFARAVVPVLGGALVIALILLATWGVAALLSGEATERLAPPTFRVGGLEEVADEIEEGGPLIFAGLGTTGGERRTVVLDHEGDDPALGWNMYWAYPADRDPSCDVTQEEGSRRFTDCEGRILDVTELARPPRGVQPVVENQRDLVLDLRPASASTTT
jgi:hypothetical protein